MYSELSRTGLALCRQSRRPCAMLQRELAGCRVSGAAEMSAAKPQSCGALPVCDHDPAQLRCPCMQEVHARLGELYPECDIAHLPSEAIQLSSSEAQPPPVQPGQEQECQAAGEQQPPVAQQAQQQDGQAEDVARPPKRSRTATDGGGAAAGAAAGAVDCACFVANAAVAGDVFRCAAAGPGVALSAPHLLPVCLLAMCIACCCRICTLPQGVEVLLGSTCSTPAAWVWSCRR